MTSGRNYALFAVGAFAAVIVLTINFYFTPTMPNAWSAINPRMSYDEVSKILGYKPTVDDIGSAFIDYIPSNWESPYVFVMEINFSGDMEFRFSPAWLKTANVSHVKIYQTNRITKNTITAKERSRTTMDARISH